MIRQHELDILNHQHEEEVVRSMLGNNDVPTTEPAPIQQVAAVVDAVQPLVQTSSFADEYQKTLAGADPIIDDGYGNTSIDQYSAEGTVNFKDHEHGTTAINHIQAKDGALVHFGSLVVLI